VAALCAHDAHGLPAYEDEFRALSFYVPPTGAGAGARLPADAEEAARVVIEHVAAGRGWCAFHALGDGDGFALLGLDPEHRTIDVGSTLEVQLPARTPEQVEVRVWGPGRLLEDGRRIEIDGPGALQVEVWAHVPGLYLDDGWRPWLVPSPIRAQRAQLPEEAAVAAPAGE
jgi:hypothetical protein